MKQNEYLNIKLLLLAILFSFISCEDKVDFSVLPSETQSGNDTFGCYVDGKIFIGNIYTTWQQDPIFVEYYSEIDLLLISADGKFEDGKMGEMSMKIYHPKVDIPLNMNIGRFNCSYWTDSKKYEESSYGLTEGGEVIITKFDTINKIVSGRFNMTAKKLLGYLPSDGYSESDSIKLHEGRFDLKINKIYNNLKDQK